MSHLHKFIKYVKAMAHFCKVFLFFPKSKGKKEKSGLLSSKSSLLNKLPWEILQF